jgi:protein-arginine kinase activator protein McsA
MEMTDMKPKEMICDVCEDKKPITELKHGRYCNLVVCDSCREDTSQQDDPGGEQDEEWSDI